MSDQKRPYHKNKPDEEEALWEYVSGSMSSEEAHLLEAEKIDDPFWNDAVEGLGQMDDKQKMRKIALQLQQQVRKDAGLRNSKRASGLHKRHQQQNIVITVLILLLLIACYFFFHFGIKK